MRTLTAIETRAVAGGDMMGDAMIRAGRNIEGDGHTLASVPWGKQAGYALEGAGSQLVDAGKRHNDATRGGPPGGGPNGG